MTTHGADDTLKSPHRRRRLGVFPLGALVTIALLVAGCGASTATTEPVQSTAVSVPAEPEIAADPTPTPATESRGDTSEATTEPGDGPDPEVSPGTAAASTPNPLAAALAAADTELPPAQIGFEGLMDAGPTGPQPVSISIPGIDVSDAEIIAVGVNQDDLSFEVPPADQVGWYEFGAAPGQAGSAVLAAHIAYNGVDGVFRHLERVEIGAVVVVGFDDGTELRYRIEDVAEYDKDALPDSVWAHDGPEQLALITCGGVFDRELRTYESNTVAIAVPI